MQLPIAATLLAASLATGAAPEQTIGRPIVEDVELEDFANVGAESFEQFTGRAVLVEFFAHW